MTGSAAGLRAAVAGRLRSVARHLYHLPDRWLHRRRHRKARRRLVDHANGASVERASPHRVLFVCWGNICRSPYAEHAFRSRLPPVLRERVRVESAGFFGPDRPPPVTALEVAARRGVDLSGHGSRLVTPGLVAIGKDLVFVMEPDQMDRLRQNAPRNRATVLVLGDLDPGPIRSRAIPDPYGHPPEFFEEVYERIDRALEVAVDALQGAVARVGTRDVAGPGDAAGPSQAAGPGRPEDPVAPERPDR